MSNGYTVGANAWTSFASLPIANLASFPMVTLHGRPYVFGGEISIYQVSNTVYTFDANTWAARTPMKVALWSHSAVALDNDTALVYADAVWVDTEDVLHGRQLVELKHCLLVAYILVVHSYCSGVVV